MDRRTLIGGGAATTAAAALLAATPGPALAAALDVVVFGDSYSQVPRAGFPNWVTQLEQAGRIRVVRNFAKSGATAATVGMNHFARQLRLWRAAGRPVGQRVIVFLGVNDILHTDTFDASYAGYRRGLAELRAAGANLLLVEPLDLGETPGYAGGPASATVTAKTRTWNRFVRGRGLPVVRLFDGFAPRLPDRSLFQDAIHLNQRGHAIVAGAVRAKLAP
jgi:lysophospholipase L1-like esterase